MANTNETLRQQVQEKAPQELLHLEGHLAFFVFVRGVSPAERNLFIRERDQPMVGYGDAVRVAAQIAKRMLRAAERAFRIDHPVVAE